VIGLSDIRHAREHVYTVARPTPLLASESLSARFGAEVLLKAECLQRTGSFKVRGAANRLAALTAEERKRGVITASAGNHAQGVAVAARALGVPAAVVMPRQAALAKLQAARRYGAEVILHGEDLGEAMVEAERLASLRALTYIPAFDDELVVAGQGTLGLELLADCPEVESVIVPVGGGGLIGGVAAALKALRPDTRVVGVQAAAAPAAALSLEAGSITPRTPGPTIADGVAVTAPGVVTLPLLQRYVDEIVTVDEEAIAQAIVLLLEDAKLVCEGAGALGVAALIAGAVAPRPGANVVVLSGGNIDINVLAAIVQHGLLYENRYLTLQVDFDDKPGSLAGLLAIVAGTGANVLEVVHIRQGIKLPLRGVEVRLLLETRDHEHIEELTRRIGEAGFILTESTATSRSFMPAGWLR
jgi:threonine dehydratase